MASNIAYFLPMFAEPAVPTPPWNSAASSVIMSPYRLGSTKTLKSLRRMGSISLAVVISIYQSSVTISGYSWPIIWAVFKNLPSVVLMMLALVMMDTLPLWFFWA